MHESTLPEAVRPLSHANVVTLPLPFESLIETQPTAMQHAGDVGPGPVTPATPTTPVTSTTPATPATPATSTTPATSMVAEYEPALPTRELIERVRALLADQRRAERLLCRYLADLAERVRGRSDPELGAYADELHAARCCFGLGVQQTRERLRIGFALRTLPAIERAFVDGDLSYSRVREVTRVASTETELPWLELAQRLDMRALERRVAGVEEAARMAAGAMTTTAAFQCMEQQRRGVGDPARGVGRQPHRELPAGPAPAAPRSRQSQGNRHHDGIGETHSAFTVCGFWCVEALARLGHIEEAEAGLERLVGYANHVGLFSEDIDPKTGAQWGNFPQTYSHVGLINAAFAVSPLPLEVGDP